MVLFNYSTRELTAKIVYYGPGLCGKTTNLQYVYGSLPEDVKKGKMLSLATKTDRTLFFDFLPIDLGTIRGMKTRIQLYTVPGQVFYNSTRKLVLKGADGVVFVADSQSRMAEANIESYRNLEENLREMGIKIDEIPLVMQFNKRDLPNLASVEEMNTRINRHNAPFYESVAMTGIGVEDTLKAITKLVLSKLSTKYSVQGATTQDETADLLPRRQPAAPPEPAAPPAPAQPTGPEELALDALDIEEPVLDEPPAPGGATVAIPAVPPQPAPPSETAMEDAVLDLVDEVPLDEVIAADDEAIDLGEEFLPELEDSPTPGVVHPFTSPAPAPTVAPAPPVAPAPSVASAHPVAPARAAAPVPQAQPRPMQQARAAAEPIDLDEPIDLQDALEPIEPITVASPQEVAIGPVAPGEVRQIEVPITIDIGGKKVTLQLKIGVRLST
jgi:signal recognition particle receptor subunit beta